MAKMQVRELFITAIRFLRLRAVSDAMFAGLI
jgi:hypothetical protein